MNENSRIFVAPKPGVYKFIFKGTVVWPNNFPKFLPGIIALVYMYLMINNDVKVGKADFVPNSSSYANELMIKETLKLNRGDKVYLYPGTESANIKYLEIFGLNQDKSSFSGFLLHEFDE